MLTCGFLSMWIFLRHNPAIVPPNRKLGIFRRRRPSNSLDAMLLIEERSTSWLSNIDRALTHSVSEILLFSIMPCSVSSHDASETKLSMSRTYLFFLNMLFAYILVCCLYKT